MRPLGAVLGSNKTREREREKKKKYKKYEAGGGGGEVVKCNNALFAKMTTR